ncbi:family 16 glycoside hydrolase [Geodermatophilus sp. SYSU D01105]
MGGVTRSEPSTPGAATADSALAGVSFPLLPTGTRWVDGTQVGAWRSVYDGYGTTRVEPGESPVLSQHPAPATSAEATHGALAVTVAEYGDVDFTVRQRTVSQLRSPEPNPWEVPWALWAYTDDQHFYYLVLKPNGWELGKEDPAYPGAQRFLATGDSPTFPVGTWHTVRIRQTGATIEAWGDGRLLTRFTDRERPYRGGHLGLYTEDAHVEHAGLVLHRG